MGHLLAKAIFDDPTKVEYVIQSSDSRIPNVLTDKVDITCQFMTVTAGRAQQVDFTIPYYREGVGLLLMKNGKYKNFDEVKAAGSAATVSVLQNVYAEELVHQALPEAKVDQYDSVDLIYQALNSGRADAAATDMSSAQWFVAQNPDQYIEGGYGWSPQTYSCAVKKGDLEFLHFVDIAFREAMTGVDFPTYAASFKKWFGESSRRRRRSASRASCASTPRSPVRSARRAAGGHGLHAQLRRGDPRPRRPALGAGARPGDGARRARRRLADRHRRRACRGLWRPAGAHRSSALYVGLIRNVPILVLALFTFFALPQYRHPLLQRRHLRRGARRLCRRLPRRVVPRRDPRHPAGHHRSRAVDRADRHRHRDLGRSCRSRSATRCRASATISSRCSRIPRSPQ